MTDYSKGKIYKIVCNVTGDVYIGSTCEKTVAQRLTKHRSDYKRYLNGTYHYVTSFKILANENYNIYLIELYPCSSRDELKSRERFYIEGNICVNKNVPGRTVKEYQQEYYVKNKEQLLKNQKQYQETNFEQLKEYQKQYRDTHKNEIKDYRKHRYQANDEKIKQYFKEYYEKNKQQLFKKYTCNCGGKYIHQNKLQHSKTNKHKNWLQKINNQEQNKIETNLIIENDVL